MNGRDYMPGRRRLIPTGNASSVMAPVPTHPLGSLPAEQRDNDALIDAVFNTWVNGLEPTPTTDVHQLRRAFTEGWCRALGVPKRGAP